MYQTQRLYISNCLDLWLSLLICKFLIFCVTIATHLDNSLSSLHIIIRITYIAFISRIVEYFFAFPDHVVDWRQLGIKEKYISSRPRLNHPLKQHATEGQLKTFKGTTVYVFSFVNRISVHANQRQIHENVAD